MLNIGFRRASILAGLFVLGLGLALTLGLILSYGGASAQANDGDQRRRLAEAASWLVQAHQNSDGGYTSFSSGADLAPSDVGGTVDALIALGASGYNPAAPFPGRSATPIDYLRDNAESVAAYAAQDGGSAGKLLMALVAATQDPRNFAGYNFVISMTAHLSPTGQLGAANAFNQSLAILALSAVNEPVPVSAREWLLGLQQPDGDLAGSWDDGFGTLGNTDATAMAVMALLSSGRAPDDPEIVAARDFLARSQLPEGDWAYGPGLGASANSTALVLQALSALGEDFYTPESPFARNGNAPLAALLTWQDVSGAFQANFGAGRFDDFFSTVQSIPALTGKPYPFAGRYEAARMAVSCLASLQDPATGGWESFAGGGVEAGGTARAISAIAAVGDDPNGESWQTAGGLPVEALAELTPDYLAGGRGGRAGTVLQGVLAAQGDPAAFAGTNLVISITNYLSPTGEYDDTSFGPFGHNEAILGLLAAGEEPDPTAIEWLATNTPAEGWSDPDANGSTLQVLARQNLPTVGLIELLAASQLADGGWGFGETASPSSTSEIVLGLVQAGQNPFAPSWSVVLSGTVQNPAESVIAQQGEDGCWPNLFGPGSDPFGTTDAVHLLAQNPVWGEPVIALGAESATPAEQTAQLTVAVEDDATAPPTNTPEPTLVIAPTVTLQPPPTAGPEASPSAALAQAPSATPAGSPTQTALPENEASGESEQATPSATSPVLAWLIIIAAVAALLAAFLWYRRDATH